jgi:hypothetical protein
MSYKNKNSSDKRVADRDKMSSLFEPLLSANIASSLKEKNFKEYLKTGNDENFHTQLNQLSDENFLELETIVNGWFDFQHHFETFSSERFGRFNRYG